MVNSANKDTLEFKKYVKKGAGILPITYYNNNWMILCGRESEIPRSKDSGKWSDFGGGAHKNEIPSEVAIREGYEESMGIFGNKADLQALIEKKLFFVLDTGTYECFVVFIEYNKDLPVFFRKMYNYMLVGDREYLKKNNGLFEKDKIEWFNLNEVLNDSKKNIKDRKMHFRKVFLYILNKFKNKMKELDKKILDI